MTSHVPISIRPHLVNFFFQEVEGEEVHYLKYRCKSFMLHKSAALNAIIQIVLVSADMPVHPSDLSLLLEINEAEAKRTFNGTMFQPISGQNHFLKVPPEANRIINDLMDDIFRISFFYYVQGHLENRTTKEVTLIDAIYRFMEKYELMEFGFNMSSLRRMYYRMVNSHGKLNILKR